MTQTQLKQRYAEILSAEVWHGDAHMVDFCVKKAAYIVELSSGDIVALEKPTMKKDFCFGYSDSRYDTEDFDRAQAMARHARTNEDYFLSENLHELDNEIQRLESNEWNSWDYYICIPYYGQPESSQLKAIKTFYRHESQAEKYQKLTGADRQQVAEAYKIIRANFEKQLRAYLKRYGLSKVRAWSYWQDE